MQMQIMLLVCVILVCTPTFARAELVVVVHPDSTVTSLSRKQLIDIYMGRNITLPDGRQAIPLDLSPDSPLRVAFYRELVGKSVAQVNAYWARLLFTGRTTPPRVLTDTQSILSTVRQNMDAIGYIDSADLDSGVKAVLRLAD